MPDPAGYEQPHIQLPFTEPKSLGPKMCNSNLKESHQSTKIPLVLRSITTSSPFLERKDKPETPPKCRPNPNRNHTLSSLHTSQYNSELLPTHSPALHPTIASRHSSDPALRRELHCYRFTGEHLLPAHSALADKVTWKVMGIFISAVLDALVFYGNWLG